MQSFRLLACVALLTVAASVDVTPIEKVIGLIEGLKKEVENDGRSEASAYNEFACFCQSTTKSKSSEIKKADDNIEKLSADIADHTQEKKEDSTELAERKQKDEKLHRELDETTARCAKQKAEYDAEAADMNQAIKGLKDAIKAMQDSKPSLLSIKATLGKTLQMAEAMSLLTTPKHKAVAALLQGSAKVDPDDPEYKFHSNDIVQVCMDLLEDYKGEKKTLDDEWAKTKKGCDETKASLKKSILANDDAMKELSKSIDKLTKIIAGERGDLVNNHETLKDLEEYMKDLTARCEDRAHDYDQRSAMRGDELSALTEALGVLKKDVKGRADQVNQRALLLQHANVATKPAAKVPARILGVPAASKLSKIKSVSFLQDVASSGRARAFLGLSQEARKGKALDVLRQEGQRIGSLALTSLAARASDDPFKKIKGLIQKLIERLLTEAKNEATKKGFCDTELAKARKDRDFRYTESRDLNADLMGLEAKRDALTEEIKDLTKSLEEETKALKEATAEREKEKKANMETLKVAKEGFDSVNEALLILRSFYKQAAKAAFVQASPVDEDTGGPGFSGNYKGAQGGMKAVFALLETIVSDFDRTLRTTEEAEATAHREYVKLSQAAEASIAGKTTKKELDEQDLKTTNASIDTKMDGLQAAVDLLDNALQTLEELKPTCIDTGMSYRERVEKREEEMKALRKALCILDEDNVEPECKGR